MNAEPALPPDAEPIAKPRAVPAPVQRRAAQPARRQPAREPAAGLPLSVVPERSPATQSATTR
jgi:hypothetical protein